MIPVETFSATETAEIRRRIPEAKRLLLGNLKEFSFFPGHPVLLAGDVYAGIWIEHNQDNLFLAEHAPEAAWDSQRIFMENQREDGLLMFAASLSAQRCRFHHIQCVYPFARCALEIARRTNRPLKDLEAVYMAGAQFDEWLVKNRNRKGTGLTEMYCEWDTGHDNDPRVCDGGIPHTCPGDDASQMPDLPLMPVLSVDLSAMAFGGREALAELAEMLGRPEDAAHWRKKAGEMKQAIRKWLYDPEDDFYYDRDAFGFRKYRTEHITRLFLNRVVDQAEFDRLYAKWFEKPDEEFLPPFPFPSFSVSDPKFDSRCPKNSWGCNTQALTSERALLWMDHYGRGSDLTGLLSRWMKAFLKPGNHYQQEIHPFTGEGIGTSRNYSPALILFLEGAKRLGITG